jgi:hypothetical protein
LKRGSPVAERTSKQEPWNVALELRLGTDILPVTGDGEEPLSRFEPAAEVFLPLLGKKVVPRTNSIRPFKANGVFYFKVRKYKFSLRELSSSSA